MSEADKKIAEAQGQAIYRAAQVTSEVARTLGRASLELERTRIDLMETGAEPDSFFFESIDHDIWRTAEAWKAFVPSVFLPTAQAPAAPAAPERMIPRRVEPGDGSLLMLEVFRAYLKPFGDHSPSGKLNDEQHKALVGRVRSWLNICGHTDL